MWLTSVRRLEMCVATGRDVLCRLVEVCCRYACLYWIPFYITCDRTLESDVAEAARWVGRSLVFHAQSTISVISGRNAIDQIASQSFHSSRHFTVFVWRGFGDNEVE